MEIKNNSVEDVALSIFFKKALCDEDILTLNKFRDRFIQNRMIWWINFEHLKKYLRNWSQLQQFFLVYRLDENLTEWITKDEIKEDLKAFEETDSDEMKNRLKKVLRYLERKKNG